MNIAHKTTAIWVVIAALWIFCIVAGTIGQFVPAMCAGVILMLLHMMLGVAKHGVVSKTFFCYPLAIWAVLWLISFALSGYYATKYAGVMPSSTFLGLHPSFAPTVFLYWIGGQLTLNLGLYWRQDEWLTVDEWEKFCTKAHQIREMEVK